MINNKRHIKIISPSGAVDAQYINDATLRLRNWGYEVSEGKHARDQYGRFAATDEQRAEDIVSALTDPTVDFVLCSRGGYGLQRIIDQIDQALPKNLSLPIIIGFSDITELHQLAAKRGACSLHAPMCKHLSTLPETDTTIIAFRRALQEQTLSYTIPHNRLNREGHATGKLLGGNLSVLYGLQGTPYAVHDKCILFIEDIAERHYHIDRMMQSLRLSGVLSRLMGMIVGEFTDCEVDEGMQQTIQQTILSAVAQYDYPVLFDFPAGHTNKNMPLWFNKYINLHVLANDVSTIVM